MTNTEKVNAIQELRRSSAASSIPSKKVRRERSRKSARGAAITRSLRGE